MGCFVAATQNWLLIRNRWYETVALLLVCFTLFRPGFWLDLIAAALRVRGRPRRSSPSPEAMPPGQTLRFRADSQNRAGEDVEKLVRLDAARRQDGDRAARESGLVLDMTGDKPAVQSVRFGSEAAKYGLCRRRRDHGRAGAGRAGRSLLAGDAGACPAGADRDPATAAQAAGVSATAGLPGGHRAKVARPRTDKSHMTEDSSTFWKKSRVEMRAAGFDPDRAAQSSAVVTIASAWTNAHRCNNRVRQITDLLVELLAERAGNGLIVGAPAVSDALTQGTPTAGYSLVSRDVAADCFEIGHHAHHGDAMIVISGCDKTGAAALMPLARTNAFGLVLYPGTSSPGRVDFGPWAAKGTNLTIMDWAEGRAAHEAGRLSDAECWSSERNVLPGSGTCGAMFTANTMSTIAEAIGMMLPRGASHPGRLRCGRATSMPTCAPRPGRRSRRSTG